MLKCSYIIIIRDNENTISKVVDGLKKITGDFKREFIFIDDGSTDNSLAVLKDCLGPLPAVTIITNQDIIGPALSINKAIRLAQGDYVHFVNGAEIIDPQASEKLIACCKKMASEVAFGVSQDPTKFNSLPSNKMTLIEQPFKEILINKKAGIRNIGLPGSLVSLKLLEKIGMADNEIYTANMSLSLRCAKYSKFVFLDDVVSTKINVANNFIDREFEAHNNLQAIYNFMQDNEEIFTDYKPQLVIALINELRKGQINFPYSYLLTYLLSKYFKKRLNFDQIINYYKQELEKLF